MSFVRSLEPIITRLPEVQRPRVPLSFKDKLKWTFLVLIAYLLMSNTMLYGFDTQAENYFKNIQTILASRFGTLMTLGIGPIVTAGIILQLLVGAKLIDLNLADPRDRLLYNGLQKFLAIVFTLFEASVMVLVGALPAKGGDPTLEMLLIVQLFIAGLFVIYMDEVVSRWGIGSGIGLFIVAGVTQQIAWRGFNPFFEGGAPAGIIPKFFYELVKGSPDFLVLVPFIGFIITFLIVVYFESVRVEIPLTYGRFRGLRGRYPIKFIYASNIPVIFASILMANVQLWATVLEKMGNPILGTPGTATTPPSGIVKYFTIPTPIYSANFDVVHALVYSLILISLAVLFSKFWVETTGMDARSVARQLQRSGMKIPGFRGDIRIIEKVLSRYIPAVTILGGFTVGALAAFADVTGALGGGTGVLLTVGILYRMYEELAREQIFELYPALRRFVE